MKLYTQLRAGNIVRVKQGYRNVPPPAWGIPLFKDTTGEYVEITGYGIYQLQLENNWCEGVNLDKRWMNFFDFTEGIKDSFEIKINDLYTEIDFFNSNNDQFFIPYLTDGIYAPKQLRFVHELQNFHLFFADIELNINRQKLAGIGK